MKLRILNGRYLRQTYTMYTVSASNGNFRSTGFSVALKIFGQRGGRPGAEVDVERLAAHKQRDGPPLLTPNGIECQTRRV